jgi:hypothetical protein
MTTNAQQLLDNYNSIIEIVEQNIEEPRKEQLIALYQSMQETMMFAPASGRTHFHLAVPGGYCVHIKNVVNASILLTKNFKQLGGNVDFTKEQLIFAALNHDLGKLGDGTNPYYIENTSEWHKKNQGKVYNINPILDNMTVTDRALFLLQSNNIKVDTTEWLGIKCSDGMHDESNKFYLHNYDESKQMRTNLPLIIHWADNMSCMAERNMS